MSIAETFVVTYRMERACAMQLAFQQTGAQLHPIDQKVVVTAYDKSTNRAIGSDWQRCRLNGKPCSASTTGSVRPTDYDRGGRSYS
jgi:hypothetical protein